MVTVRERRPPLQAGVGRGRGDVFVLNIRVGGYNPELLHCHAWSSALCQLWRGDVWRWASGPHTSAGRSRSPILLAAAPPRRPFRRRAPIVLPPSPPLLGCGHADPAVDVLSSSLTPRDWDVKADAWQVLAYLVFSTTSTRSTVRPSPRPRAGSTLAASLRSAARRRC